MLDVIVLIAMAVTAAAFGAGLTLQAGLPWLPVVIGAIALFLVMAATFFKARGGGSGDRLDDLEQALEVIDLDLQRLDRVEDGMTRLQALHDKVERIDQHVAGGSGGAPAGASADLADVYARIEAVRAEVVNESRAQRQKIVNDLGALEGLIAGMAGQMSSTPAAAAAVPLKEPAMIDPEPLPEPLPEPEMFAEPETPAEPEIEPEPELVAEVEELVAEAEEMSEIEEAREAADEAAET
ncbi:MAG: hypothetical protein AAF405_01085, partial [Pseudomonadota bacterium]